jgi:hypothetical protein
MPDRIGGARLFKWQAAASADVYARNLAESQQEAPMSISKRLFVGGAAILAALLMVAILTGFASAGTAETVCVTGYVINHRELAVNGTEVTPTLRVEAVDARGQSVFADVDKSGYFKFEKLPAGDYNFRMQLPDGWDGLVPATARGGLAETGVTTLDKRSDCYRIVFKIRRLFDLTVFKWEELLTSANVQPGVDWEITATPVKDPYVKSQTEKTDVGGRAYFTLTPGKWLLTEQVKSGWVPVTPSQVTIELDQYDPPGAMLPVIFKNREPVCGSKIVVQKLGYGTDTNGTEIQLGPVAGWKVTVRRADNSYPPLTKLTDGSGSATFAGLPPGVYSVSEQVRKGWDEMDDLNPQTVIHRDCEETLVTFRNKELPGDLRIYGYKWFAAWTSPLAGAPMAGLSSWVITATLVGTDIYTTTQTNALGYYEFTAAGLKAAGMAFPGATIEVSEEVRDNWIAATPQKVNVRFPYPVPDGYTGIRVDFTNCQDPPTGGRCPPVRPPQPPKRPDWKPDGQPDGCRTSYTVQRGDTLARIAGSHGSTVGAITRASGVPNANLIRTGQVLCIP